MKLNEKIMKIRKEHGLSQEEFGNEINVSRQAISKWENGETKPDIEKIQEINKKFNVSFDYLLNDDIDNSEKQNPQDIPIPKEKNKILFKIVLIIILLLLLIIIYKAIILTRFYLIANSFSEENYSMSIFSSGTAVNEESYSFAFRTEKYGHKIIHYSSIYEGNYIPTLENEVIPYNQIEYIDGDNKINYYINYDAEKNVYIYEDSCSIFDKENQKSYTKEELEEALNFDKNLIKDATLSEIPSSFKEILISSLNPFCIVSLKNRTIVRYSILNNAKLKISLNEDYILHSIQLFSEFDGKLSNYYSYDYVPSHQKELQDPLEIFKDKIEY